MRGFATTPAGMVDAMVDLLFRHFPPDPQSRVLDPGCGTGVFIDGVIRWCERRGIGIPQIIGVELDVAHIDALKDRFSRYSAVTIVHRDFLDSSVEKFDYIVGNPPYVPITGLTEAERAHYRLAYATARGRFDLYILFYEQALRQLAPGGRLVFITPEKFMYVDTAGPLRHMLASRHVEEIRLVDETTFGELITYPTVTSVRGASRGVTHVVSRNGTTRKITLPPGYASWQPIVEGGLNDKSDATLENICLRISCGVATGADGVFVREFAKLDRELRRFAHMTVSGRELKDSTSSLFTSKCMLIPYDERGRLLPERELGPLGDFLRHADNRDRLLARTCVLRKPWYAFHETPDLQTLRSRKIVWKDISPTARFWLDDIGQVVPRHSVYYLVPKRQEALDPILDYLRSETVRAWLARNCQRAAKGYLRLQSSVLKRLPIPSTLVGEVGYQNDTRRKEEEFLLVSERQRSIA